MRRHLCLPKKPSVCGVKVVLNTLNLSYFQKKTPPTHLTVITILIVIVVTIVSVIGCRGLDGDPGPSHGVYVRVIRSVNVLRSSISHNGAKCLLL